MVYFESNQGRQVYMLTTYLFRYTLQNAPFRSQNFTIFFVSGGKGGVDPLTKILRTFLHVSGMNTRD